VTAHPAARRAWAVGVLLVIAVAAGIADAQPARTERAEILERLGVASLQARNYAEAARYLRDAISAGRDHWEIRQNLGFALAALDRCDEAVDELERSIRLRAVPRTLVYLGRCYDRLHKPGVAIHALEQAVARAPELNPGEQKDAYALLGYLYATGGEHARAVDAWHRAVALGDDPELALRLARAQRLSGSPRAARETLGGIAPARLSPASQAMRLDELAALSRAEARLAASIAELAEAARLEPSAARHHALGLAYRELDRPRRAVEHLERAHALAPEDTGYATALGYAYKEVGRLHDAARVFEAVVAREPDQVALYAELGYLYKSLADTPHAVAWFRKAIDHARLAGSDATSTQIAGLQSDVARLSKRFDMAAFMTYRSSSGQPGAGSVGALGGTLPSQSGVEVAYQPPVIGFRDDRIFQVFGRLLWNFEAASLDLDGDSVQAGIGVRYKAFRNQNLFLSAERLIAIGDQAQDDWLLRALYSWEYHPLLPPDRTVGNYTTAFGDVAYFAEAAVWAFYGELRQGLTWRALSRLLVTPHVVVDARYQDSRGPTDSFVEGGGGVSLRYLFNESPYEGLRSSVELLVQYKAGRFFERAHAVVDSDFHGLVLTGILRF
jgi:bacteriophage N4 adsorption protein A